MSTPTPTPAPAPNHKNSQSKKPTAKKTKKTQTKFTPQEKSDFIKKQVMNRLGKLKNFNFIKANNVFDNNWRVDVWCYRENDKTLISVKDNSIDYSFFVTTDNEGKILSSDPEITKQNKFNMTTRG